MLMEEAKSKKFWNLSDFLKGSAYAAAMAAPVVLHYMFNEIEDARAWNVSFGLFYSGTYAFYKFKTGVGDKLAKGIGNFLTYKCHRSLKQELKDIIETADRERKANTL